MLNTLFIPCEDMGEPGEPGSKSDRGYRGRRRKETYIDAHRSRTQKREKGKERLGRVAVEREG